MQLGQQGHLPLHHIGDEVRVRHDHLIGPRFAQVGKLLQHIVRGAEVQRHILIRVGKSLGTQKDMAEDLVLRIHEVHVARGAHGLSQLVPQGQHTAVEIPQLLQ